MAHRSRNRGVLERRARRRRRLWPLVGLVLVVCGALLAMYSLRTSDADTAATSGAGTSQSGAGTSGSGSGPATPAKQVLRVTRLSRLAAPVQDAAVTTVGSRAYAFGGWIPPVRQVHHLGVAGIVGDHRRATARAGPRPRAAASPSGSSTCSAAASSRARLASPPRPRQPRLPHLVGALPTPLSDLAVATVSGTPTSSAGYTGTQWSDDIYAVNGSHGVGAGRCPRGCATHGCGGVGNVIIAGGRARSGPSRAVYRFAPPPAGSRGSARCRRG